MMDDKCTQIGNFYDMDDCFWTSEKQHQSYYRFRILGYLDLICCIIIVISNAFVVLTLSRKSATSSMNTIFTHIAITESLAGLSYIPRVWQEFFRVEECAIPQHRTLFWEELSLNSYKLAFMFRQVGVWLAVMLAVWRYIAVIHPLKERHWCNPEITRTFIKLGYAFGATMVIPKYFALQIGSTTKLLDNNGCSTSNNTTGRNTTIYELQVPLENNPLFFILGFSFHGIFLKLLPSVAFTFISYRLIIRLIEVKKQRKSISQQLDRQTDRTTISLVLISILFLIGELPYGILCMLTIYHGPPFFWKFVYYGFEICNTLTYVSECFNFVIYYVMSKQFRETFKELVRGKTNELCKISVLSQSIGSRSEISTLSIISNQGSSIITGSSK